MSRRAALALAVALVLSGCGGANLSLSQLRSRATLICRHVRTRENLIRSPSEASQASAFLSDGARLLGAAASVLGSLKPSGHAAVLLSNAVRHIDLEAARLRTAGRTLDRGADPVATVRRLERDLQPLEAAAGRDWTALGIPACAQL